MDPTPRRPWLTAAVLVVTSVLSVVGDLDAGVLHALERRPAGLHGEPWRVLTALVVQDGGWAGTAVNLAGLALLGLAAERVVGRRAWVVGYLAPALVGEAAGYAWQPVGAGNSVAVCGLAGLVSVALLRGQDSPEWARQVTLVWVGVLLALASPPLLVPYAVVGLAAARAPRPLADRVTVSVLAAAGALLVALRDIHGAAVLGGLVVALAVPPDRSGQGRSTYASTQRPSSS